MNWSKLSKAQKIWVVIGIIFLVGLIGQLVSPPQPEEPKIIPPEKVKVSELKNKPVEKPKPKTDPNAWKKQPKYIQLDKILTNAENLLVKSDKLYNDANYIFCNFISSRYDEITNRANSLSSQITKGTQDIINWIDKYGQTTRYEDRRKAIILKLSLNGEKFIDLGENPYNNC